MIMKQRTRQYDRLDLVGRIGLAVFGIGALAFTFFKALSRRFITADTISSPEAVSHFTHRWICFAECALFFTCAGLLTWLACGFVRRRRDQTPSME